MPDRSAPTTEPTATTRRTVLRAAGLAALTGGGVAVLGACASDGQAGTPTSSAPATSASSAPATSPAPAESPSASASASASASKSAAPSGPGVATSKIPVGGGVILDDADYVITQPTKGEFRAFGKICTHQNCPVTAIDGGTINCSCHGSKFSIKDGSVTVGPATRPLPEADVTVAGSQVVVTA
ncbi:MAG TPA: Rieske (2Fe-2S) protein [Propionibacteriaceae bacterium]|jgi:Rieske Fe-S protein|nr:Rieske (2Fe-2S) protein [Propionibacteriaceae bacterium]